MKRVHLSPAAREDLFEIWFYISADDEKAADAFIDRLQSACQLLADSPGIGPLNDQIDRYLRRSASSASSIDGSSTVSATTSRSI